jgi:protocatechuate 3,4-dioxygenase beta subunit
MVAVLALLLAACAPSSATGPQATAAPATPIPTVPATAAMASAASPVATATDATGAGVSPMTATETAVPAAAVTVAPAVTAVAGSTATTAAATPAPAAAAPVCTPGALTPALTEGPYYKANPPANSALTNPSMTGTKLTITGYVLNANCQPIAGARVDFWQADAAGQYDNQGYTLRGYQMTDAQGRYTVETVVPGLYPGRTRHIHVKVTPPNGSTLTTQLFFPNEAQNSSDSIFAPQNVLTTAQSAAGETASFNFVVQG